MSAEEEQAYVKNLEELVRVRTEQLRQALWRIEELQKPTTPQASDKAQ